MESGVPGDHTVFVPDPVVGEPGAPVETATSQSKKNKLSMKIIALT